jgi:hypothetical protein
LKNNNNKEMKGNVLVAGILAAFVSTTYVSVIRRTSSNDIEHELEREIIEECARQAKQQRGS